MDMNPLLRLFPFRFGWAQRILVGILRLQAERSLDLKGPISGRTPPEASLDES